MRKKIFVLYSAVASLAIASCNNAPKTSSSEADKHPAEQEAESHDASAHQAASAPAANQEPAAILPQFAFYQLRSGIKVTNADLSKDKNSVFILFDPGCSHCQSEAMELEKNLDKIKDVHINYVSMNDPALVLGFFDNFAPKLSKSENVEVLIDKYQDFIQKIHIPAQFPANYVYGPDGKLKAYWEGDKNINEAIQAFHQ